MDEGTKSTVSGLPLLTVRASPRDKEAWTARLREELTALISYVKTNKEQDKDWFHVECNPQGTRWTGKCWYYYDRVRYEFDLEFDIPVTYPAAAPELKLPQLDGLTSKMYRGGKICQTVHFQPLWARNVPRFGIAHSLALSVSLRLVLDRNFLRAVSLVVTDYDYSPCGFDFFSWCAVRTLACGRKLVSVSS